MFVLQRAKRLGLVSLVACTAAAVSVIDRAGLETASAQPVVTLYASPGRQKHRLRISGRRLWPHSGTGGGDSSGQQG